MVMQAEGYVRLSSRVAHVSLSPVDPRRGTVCCTDGTSYVVDFPAPPSSKLPPLPYKASPSSPAVAAPASSTAKDLMSVRLRSVAFSGPGTDYGMKSVSTNPFGSDGGGGNYGVTTRTSGGGDSTSAVAATAVFEGRPARLIDKPAVRDLGGIGDGDAGICKEAGERDANNVGGGTKVMKSVVGESAAAEGAPRFVEHHGAGGKDGVAEEKGLTEDSAWGGARAGIGGEGGAEQQEEEETRAGAGGSSASTAPRRARVQKVWDPVEQLELLNDRGTTGGVEAQGTGVSTTGCDNSLGVEGGNGRGASLENGSGSGFAGNSINSALSSQASLGSAGVDNGAVGGGSGGNVGGRSRGPVQAGRAVWGEDGETLFLLSHEGEDLL